MYLILKIPGMNMEMKMITIIIRITMLIQYSNFLTVQEHLYKYTNTISVNLFYAKTIKKICIYQCYIGKI